jgi:hypothetical protein
MGRARTAGGHAGNIHESRLDTRGDTRVGARDDREVVLRAPGIWFDGLTSRRRRARLRLSDRSLRLWPDGDAPDGPPSGVDAAAPTPAPDHPHGHDDAQGRRHRLADLVVGERWDHAPLAVTLPDGGTVWIEDDGGGDSSAFARALVERTAAARRKAGRSLPWPPVGQVIASWPAVVACLLATIALLVWFDRRGAAWAATTALHVVPRSVDQRVGDAAWASISRQWLGKTGLPELRQLRLQQRFRGVAADVAPDTHVELLFHRLRGGARDAAGGRGGGGDGRHDERRHTRDDEDDGDVDARPGGRPEADPPPHRRDRADGGFNAFAVPNGKIVVLDGLADTLTDDELMSVLGHELGHVVHRHSMKGVMRSAGLLTVAGVVFGDFSSVLASSVATLQSLHYSRDDEREADAFGRRFADAAKLPPGTEAAVWRKFQKEEKRMGASGIPPWLSTHPPTDERLKAAQEQPR